MSGVKHRVHYSCTGIDPPEIVKFIKQNYPEIDWLYPKMSFWEGIRKKSPPRRMMRWCCDILKKNPAKAAGIKSSIVGVRAEESARRAARGRISNIGNHSVYKPVFEWTQWHVWDFIQGAGLPYPSLYDEGFDRIGCIICPFICSKSMAKINIHRHRWPQAYRVFEKVVKDWYYNYRSMKNRVKYADQTAEQYLDVWYRGGR